MASCPGVPGAGPGRWALSSSARRPTLFVELPPTNVAPGSARLMTPLPYGEACNVHLAGTPLYEVWYRLDAIPNQYQIGFLASPEPLSTYEPVVAVFVGTADDHTLYRGLNDVSGALQFDVTPGLTYFFRVRNAGPPVPTGIVMLTISTKLSLNTTAPAGSILINDDVSGLPLVAVSSTGTGVLQSRPFPSGETAAMLPSGISLWHDASDDDHLLLYDNTLTLIASPEWARNALDAPAITTNGSDTFYVGDSRALGAQIRTVSDAGVMGGTTWVLPEARVFALAVSPDETIAYYRTATLGDGPIKRFNLTTSTAMTDLVAPVGSAQHAGELLTFSDGTTFVGYLVAGTDYVQRHAADGSLVSTYPMPGANMQINRMSRALTEESFWVWCWGTGPDAGIDTFVRIQVSDGAYLEQFTSPQYSAGVFQGPIESTEVAFGHPLSCPIIITPPPGLPPYGGGEDEPEPAPPATTEHRPIRRLRQSPHVSADGLRLRHKLLEVDLQVGVGLTTGQGSDPLVMLQTSRDGGQTWSQERVASAGAVGRYLTRVRFHRQGMARDMVYRIVVSDPVAWRVVAAYLDLDETSA